MCDAWTDSMLDGRHIQLLLDIACRGDIGIYSKAEMSMFNKAEMSTHDRSEMSIYDRAIVIARCTTACCRVCP